jgi:hypothetical protein
VVAVVKEEVTQVATPAVMAWEAQPEIDEPPFLKFTVPPGVTPPPETVAVRVVEAPTVVGLGDEVRTVVEGPVDTTMEKLELVDPV